MKTRMLMEKRTTAFFVYGFCHRRFPSSLRYFKTEQIIAEYRVRALRLHPDKTGNTHAQFAALSQAKEVLSNPEKRKAYNAWRRCPGFMSFEEWLSRKGFIGMTMHWSIHNPQARIANSQGGFSRLVRIETASLAPTDSEPLRWEPDNSVISIMFRKGFI
ncbi:DnaJ domain protein [Trichuris suis]|nr:DnaJ domain protein [Trichuris suis]